MGTSGSALSRSACNLTLGLSLDLTLHVRHGLIFVNLRNKASHELNFGIVALKQEKSNFIGIMIVL